MPTPDDRMHAEHVPMHLLPAVIRSATRAVPRSGRGTHSWFAVVGDNLLPVIDINMLHPDHSDTEPTLRGIASRLCPDALVEVWTAPGVIPEDGRAQRSLAAWLEAGGSIESWPTSVPCVYTMIWTSTGSTLLIRPIHSRLGKEDGVWAVDPPSPRGLLSVVLDGCEKTIMPIGDC